MGDKPTSLLIRLLVPQNSWRRAILGLVGQSLAAEAIGGLGLIFIGVVLKIYGALTGAKWAFYLGHGLIVLWVGIVGGVLVYFTARHTIRLRASWKTLSLAVRTWRVVALLVIWAGLFVAGAVAIIVLF